MPKINFHFLKKPKIFIPLIIGLIFIGLIVYQINLKNHTNYQTAKVKRGNLSEIVSTTGRVQSAQSVDLSFKRSGRVIFVNGQVGQSAKDGTLLAKIDCQDLEKTLADAKISLASAQNVLEKLETQYQQLLRQDTLNKNYEDALIILGAFYQQSATILENIQNIYFKNDLSNGNENNITYYSNYNSKFQLTPYKADSLYNEVKLLQQEALNTYQIAQRGSGDERYNAIEKGYSLLIKMADLIKLGRDPILDLYNYLIINNATHNKQAEIENHLQQLTSYANIVDGYLQNLLTLRNAINTQRDALINFPFDIKNQKLVVEQWQNTISDTQKRLNDCSIIAPFSGIITNLDLKKDEIVSANLPVISLIAKDQFEIESPIPEIDIAKIKINNEAIVTLDAYGSGKTLKAKVIHIDPAATLLEGVPTYKVKLQLINPDVEIKVGMTANLDIICQQKENILIVPRRAVFNENGKKFVRVLKDKNVIEEREVETGIGGEGMIEITNGLNEGEIIIVSGK
ncbi:MAG: efflux RND transporter periplasmic adaptor subunit [Minisyncoccia bacterium]